MMTMNMIIHYFDSYCRNNSDDYNTVSSSSSSPPTFKKYQRRRSLGCHGSLIKKQQTKYHRRRSLGSCHDSNSFLSTIDEHNENENTNIDESIESNEFEYEYDYLDYDDDYNDNIKCNNNNNNNVSIIEGVMNIIMIYSIIIIILGGTAIIAFEKGIESMMVDIL